eukprot:scaffold977_cov38-Phaeocystis_antarctica.AAC.2
MSFSAASIPRVPSMYVMRFLIDHLKPCPCILRAEASEALAVRVHLKGAVAEDEHRVGLELGLGSQESGVKSDTRRGESAAGSELWH